MATQLPVLADRPASSVLLGTASAAVKDRNAKKKLLRRTGKDYSQLYRRTFQAMFGLLNLWIGVKFYFWVRVFEVNAVAETTRVANTDATPTIAPRTI